MTGRSGIARIGFVTLIMALGLASCMMAQQTGQDSQADPNLPGTVSPDGLKIRWNFYGGQENPQIAVVDPVAERTLNRLAADYIGWNQEGSWLKNTSTGHILVWNLKNNSVTVRYKSDREIPQETLASLNNFKSAFDYLLPKSAKPAKPASASPGTVAPNDPRANLKKSIFGDPESVRAAVGGVQRGATPPGAHAPVSAGDISGTGAAIQGGVLTFTLPDHSTATYKVVRPKVMQGNPQASADITGAWIAMGENGKGLLFSVQADKSVTAKEMPAQVVQMLMQGGPQR